jgi:hypothetical protein
MLKIFKSEKGFALISVFLLILIGGVLITSYVSSLLFNIRFSRDKLNKDKAYYAAQSGVQHLKADVNSFIEEEKIFKIDDYNGQEATYTIKDQGENNGTRKFLVEGSFNNKNRSITIEYNSSPMDSIKTSGKIFQMMNGTAVFNGHDHEEQFVNKMGSSMVDYLGEWSEIKSNYESMDLKKNGKTDKTIKDKIVFIDFDEINKSEVKIGGSTLIDNTVIIAGGSNTNDKTIIFDGGASIEVRNSIFFLYDNVGIKVNGSPPTLTSQWDNESEYSIDQIGSNDLKGEFQNWSIQ